MHDVIRRLLKTHSERFPVLSIYLDTRPLPAGRRGGRRPFQVYLRSRLRDLGRELLPGEGLESFERDCAAVWAQLAELGADVQGVAIVACHGEGVFEMHAVEQPFENQVALGAEPVLYPLACRLEGDATYAIVVADSERARVYTVRLGHIQERARVHQAVERPELPGRGSQRVGASQLKYQRYLRNQVHAYLADVVEALERVVAEESVRHVILAGTDKMVAELLRMLSPSLEHKVIETMRLEADSPQGEILRATLTQFQLRLEKLRVSRVEELLSEHRAGGLATVGLEATVEALYRGQVEELVLRDDCHPWGRFCPRCQHPVLAEHVTSCPDCEGPLGEPQELLEELLRQAARTDVHLEVLTNCERLREHAGMGALLRYADSLD